MRCTEPLGKRCCGLEGALCRRDRPGGVHCECCPDLFCTLEGRCQEEFT